MKRKDLVVRQFCSNTNQEVEIICDVCLDYIYEGVECVGCPFGEIKADK